MVDNILFTFVEVGTVVIEMVLIIFYSHHLKMQPNCPFRKRSLCFALFFLPLAILSACPIMPAWRVVYSFIGLTVLYRYCYKVDMPNSIYMTAFFLILSAASDIICSYCLALVGITNNGFSDTFFDRITYNTISKLIHLILIQTSPILVRQKKPQLSLVGALPLLTAHFFSLVICVCLYYSGVKTGVITSETIIGVLATLYVNLVICFYIEAIGEKNELALEKEGAERENQYNLKYFEIIKQSQEETRSLWHEIQKYMNTIQALVGDGNNQAAFQCMAEVEQIFDRLTVNVDVGNRIINSVLSIGLQKAKQSHIPFHIDAWVSPELSIAPQDLFIILGNAIDNAIEECNLLSNEMDPYINVFIHQKGNILVIEVKNPCCNQSNPKPGKIHGYGLKNVRRCISKYEGELQAEVQNGIFRFLALLNIQEIPINQ